LVLSCHFLGSCHARHGTDGNCNSIVVSLPNSCSCSCPCPCPFPSLPPLRQHFRLASLAKMFELLSPTAICGENCDLLLNARDFHQLSTSSSLSSPGESCDSSSSSSFGSFAFCSDTYHTVWQMLHKVLLNSLEVFNEMLLLFPFSICHFPFAISQCPMFSLRRQAKLN